MSSLTLDEVMTGSWSPDTAPPAGDLEQFVLAEAAGARAGRVLELLLTLTTDDLEAVARDLSTPLAVSGSVRLGGLLDEPAAVQDGCVELVVPDPAEPQVQHMRYELPLPGAGLHLSGQKVLCRGDLLQLWPASTTLYSTLHDGGAGGSICGRGIVRIAPADFARQLGSIDVGGGRPLEAAAALARFGAAFFDALWDDYGTVVHRSTRLRRSAPARPHRPLDLPPKQRHPYRTEDGLDLRLTRYCGGRRGPVVLVHGMGANPLTYLTDTIPQNLTEHLVAHGYDVWLQEWRGSTTLPTSQRQLDADQVAHLDHPAAEATVRRVTGSDAVHWVTHCVGSMTWMMATLAGTTTPASLVLSSVAAHPVAPVITRLKAAMRAPNLLRRLGVKLLTTESYDDESARARLLDLALRFHPIPREERCDSAVCRRLAFIYGVAVHHHALDDATHDALHELFGVTDLTMMEHLARCAREGRLVTAGGDDAYLPHVERARLPITLLHGARNRVWLPESTARTHDWLRRELGPQHAARVVFEGHGHQDTFVGAQAADDAFPAIVAHLNRAGA